MKSKSAVVQDHTRDIKKTGDGEMKLFAIDMDGTLLNEEGKISKVNAESIRQAQQQAFRW